MRHIKNVTVAQASTNPSNSLSLGLLVWLGSMIGVIKQYG